jgi:hypothetical protein
MDGKIVTFPGTEHRLSPKLISRPGTPKHSATLKTG